MTRKISFTAVATLVCFTLSSSFVLAQSSEDMKALQKDVESLEAGQKAIPEDLQTIKDILMGKKPPLENVFISTDGGPQRMKAVSMLSGAQSFTAFKEAIDKLLNPPKEEGEKDKATQ